MSQFDPKQTPQFALARGLHAPPAAGKSKINLAEAPQFFSLATPMNNQGAFYRA
jgi:hypothetical protein